MGACSELLAGDDAGGDGIDVLDRAPDLRADDVIAPIAAEGRVAQRVRKRPSLGLLCRGKCHGGWEPPGYLGSEARAREDGDCASRQHVGDDLGGELASRLLDALGADHHWLPGLHIGRELTGDAAHLLRRRHHQQHIAIGDLIEPRGRLYCRIELDARQIDLVPMLPIDVGDGLSLIGPDENVAAGAMGRDGERGAPCASAHDADRLKRHAMPSWLLICQILCLRRNQT